MRRTATVPVEVEVTWVSRFTMYAPADVRDDGSPYVRLQDIPREEAEYAEPVAVEVVHVGS